MPNNDSTWKCSVCGVNKNANDFYRSIRNGKIPLVCHVCRKTAKKPKPSGISKPYQPKFKIEPRRNELIRKATPSEIRLMGAFELFWKNKGVQWEFQKPIGPFFADFAIPKAKVVIEIDGDYHLGAWQESYDLRRTDYLENKGWTVMRFTNERVDNQLLSVVRDISRSFGLTIE